MVNDDGLSTTKGLEKVGIAAQVLQGLIKPSPEIKDPERRRRARSLSLLLLVTLVMMLILVIGTIYQFNPNSIEENAVLIRLELVAFAILIGVYALSRSGHFMLAASITIGIFLVSTFSAAIYGPSVPTILSFVILGGLISSLFLSPRATAMIFALTCIGLLMLYRPFNRFSGLDIFREVFFAAIVGVFVLVMAIVREQYLYQIRKQSHVLADREELLAVTLESTNETNSRLHESMKTLEQYNREITLLAKLGNLLEACTTVDESYRVIGSIAPQLFPGFSGALYAYGPSRDDFEPVTKWGYQPDSLEKRTFEPDKCWALRLARPHKNDGLCMGIPCAIVAPADNSLCVPMMANGYTIGIFYLLKNLIRDDIPEGHGTNEALAIMTAEHIALALANLRLQETLRLQSILDPLTGLFNRRFMQETLLREMRRADRDHLPVGVIMIDLDHFKQFNDSFGHGAGDTLLRRLSEILKMTIRSRDIACRFGGEEFVIILPEASLDTTHRRAEEIRSKVKELTVEYHGQLLGAITSSFGVADFPTHANTVEALLNAADRALYRAKSEGRDRVVSADIEAVG